MIDRSIIEARIRRSGITEFAEQAYGKVIPPDVLKSLAPYAVDEFLFILYSSEILWTAVSLKFIDYQCITSPKRISISEAVKKIYEFLFTHEKGTSFEIINLDCSENRMWIGNTRTVYSLLNILNLLDRDMPH